MNTKILKLKSENVKRLQVVEITPAGNVVVIGGNNGEGKSSTLDSIVYALGGKDAIPDQPIRQGETQAKVVLELEDVLITRTFTPGQTKLIVTSKDGIPVGSPQKLLDKLVGKLTFDPLEFANMPAKDQMSILKNLVGLDFTFWDEQRKKLYDMRTLINRDAETFKNQLAKFPDAIDFVDVPDDEISIVEIAKEIQARQMYNLQGDRLRQQMASLQQQTADADHRVERLQRELDLARQEADRCREMTAAAQQQIAAFIPQETASLEIQSGQADQRNAQIRQKKERARLAVLMEAKQTESRAITSEIADIDAQKQAALSAARFPIAGLAFGDDGIVYQGVPFAQASAAEQLRVSVAMGMALNPTLKVLLIRNGSLLDEKNLTILKEMAVQQDCQIWLERVGKGEECQVIIEDGLVAN